MNKSVNNGKVSVCLVQLIALGQHYPLLPCSCCSCCSSCSSPSPHVGSTPGEEQPVCALMTVCTGWLTSSMMQFVQTFFSATVARFKFHVNHRASQPDKLLQPGEVLFGCSICSIVLFNGSHILKYIIISPDSNRIYLCKSLS